MTLAQVYISIADRPIVGICHIIVEKQKVCVSIMSFGDIKLIINSVSGLFDDSFLQYLNHLNFISSVFNEKLREKKLFLLLEWKDKKQCIVIDSI